MKTNKLVFYIGVSAFFCCMGILIGVSSSPVVGVFLTGISGLIVGVAGVFYAKKESGSKNKSSNLESIPPINYNLIGFVLLFASMFVVFGAFLGSQYRLSYFKNDSNKQFVWSGNNRPTSLKMALDWIRIEEILASKGYSKEQIKYLYELKNSDFSDYELSYKILTGDNNEKLSPVAMKLNPVDSFKAPIKSKYKKIFESR